MQDLHHQVEWGLGFCGSMMFGLLLLATLESNIDLHRGFRECRIFSVIPTMHAGRFSESHKVRVPFVETSARKRFSAYSRFARMLGRVMQANSHLGIKIGQLSCLAGFGSVQTYTV